MTQDDIASILSDVLELTESNQIRWTLTSASAQFMTTLGEASLTIEQFDLGDNSCSHSITIFNSKGNAIFAYDTIEGDNMTISSLIEKIYNLVENRFYKRDETIKSLKAALKSLKDRL